MKKWYIQNPSLFQDFKQLLSLEYPTLRVQLKNGIVYVRGRLVIEHSKNTKVVDSCSIEIEIPDDYPKSIPVVRETERRFPINVDRHFDSDGRACLFVRDEQYKYYPEGASIVDFIRGPVHSFFLSQIYFDLKKRWLYGERRHGVDGIIDFYGEELGTKDKSVIIEFLRYLTRKELKGHWYCYCGSGKRLRDCHYNRVRDFRSKIPRDVAKKSLHDVGQS